MGQRDQMAPRCRPNLLVMGHRLDAELLRSHRQRRLRRRSINRSQLLAPLFEHGHYASGLIVRKQAPAPAPLVSFKSTVERSSPERLSPVHNANSPEVAVGQSHTYFSPYTSRTTPSQGGGVASFDQSRSSGRAGKHRQTDGVGTGQKPCGPPVERSDHSCSETKVRSQASSDSPVARCGSMPT